MGFGVGSRNSAIRKEHMWGDGLGGMFLIPLLAPASEGKETLLRPGVTLAIPVAIPCVSTVVGLGRGGPKLGSADIPRSIPTCQMRPVAA